MVVHRIHQAEELGTHILYHMNNSCYKKFTMKKTLEAAARKRKRDEGFLAAFIINKVINRFY